MDTYGMDPTWGALEEALAPQRQNILRSLLAGKRGIDPATTSITGDAPEGTWALREAAKSATPEAPAPPPPAAAPAPEPAMKRVPLSVYDTVYADKIRAAEKSVKDAFWGYQHKNAREDLDRWLGMAERDIARAEGRETFDATQSRYDQRAENALARSVLDASSEDAAQRAKERIAALSRKKFSKGTPIDRGEEGVFVPVMNEDTGEFSVESLPVPAKRSAPAVHGLGSGGGVYFDAQGRPRVIAPAREPRAPKEPKENEVPAAVLSSIAKEFLSQPIDPNDPGGPRMVSDPDALRKLVLLLRQNGLLPGAAAGPGPSAEDAAAMTHAPARSPQTVSGRVGGPARQMGGNPRTAVNPRTGERLTLVGGKWVPAR